MQKIPIFSISLSHKNKNKKQVIHICIIQRKINTDKLSMWKDAQIQLYEKGGG